MDSFLFDGVEYRTFNRTYAVSATGEILHNYKPYAPWVSPQGYPKIRATLVHRIVAKLWIPNPTNASFVHHRDENKANFRADNLEWVTPKEHAGDRHKDIIGKQPMPDAAKEKLRQYRLGKTHSEETKLRITEGLNKVDWASKNLKGRPGRIKSDEEKAKITASRVQPLLIDGIRYESMVLAEKALGIGKGTIRRRCLSKNFTNYGWLPREYVRPPRTW